jgi:hypothetical protein
MGSCAMVAERPNVVPVPVRGRRGADAALTSGGPWTAGTDGVGAGGLSVPTLSLLLLDVEKAAEPELESGVAAASAAIASMEARDSRWRRAMSFIDTVRRSPAAMPFSLEGAAP